METDIALPVRVRPQAFGSSMPDYLYTPEEVYTRDLQDQIETGGKHQRERESAQRHEAERRARCTLSKGKAIGLHQNREVR